MLAWCVVKQRTFSRSPILIAVLCCSASVAAVTQAEASGSPTEIQGVAAEEGTPLLNAVSDGVRARG